MRFSGNSEPASRSGVFGQVSMRLAPARMAERYDDRSIDFRPGSKSIFEVSPCRNAVSAAAGVLESLAPFAPLAGAPATSPLADFALSGVAALALGFAPQAASAANAAANESV